MNPRNLTILAFSIAAVLTIVGFQQVWLTKWTPPLKDAAWFPLLLILRLPEEFSRILLCLIQFPLFATAFSFGIRRWKVLSTLCVVLFSYALCVLAAVTTIESR